MLSSTGNKRFAGMLLAGFIATLAGGALGESAVTPGSKAAKLDACVAPIAEMRRHHMDYLKHDRVETVRLGVRDVRNSLSGCVDCHAAKDGNGSYVPINSEGQFCSGCHNYMAVSLACFQCHRKTPGEETVSLVAPSAGRAELPLGLLADKNHAAALTAEERSQLMAIVRED